MSSTKTLKLEEWGRNRPVLAVMFAHQVAMSAEACYEVCVMARGEKGIDGRPLQPPLDVWKTLYGNHRRVRYVVTEVIFPREKTPEDFEWMIGMRDGFEEWDAMSKRERRHALSGLDAKSWNDLMRESWGIMAEVYIAHIQRIRAEIAGEEELASDAMRTQLSVPEVLFFFKVSFPCWMQYGRSVGKMLREARRGDIERLRQLLRLDKRVLELPWVRRRYLDSVGDSGLYDYLHYAAGHGPAGKLTRQKVKISLAALIFKFFAEGEVHAREFARIWRKVNPAFKAARMKLKMPEVRALFDAVAQDFRGELQDDDLPESPQAFAMAVRRELKFWPSTSERSQNFF